MATNTALLAEAPFFQLLDDQERDELSRHLDVVKMPAGQLVFSYGDIGDSLYIIQQGTVEVFFKAVSYTHLTLPTKRIV